ncbi:LacI family transcriptional regulator [Actinotalea sp. M2MS4P-6]|uniref:LacI family DNA-binding transcriptional regulator n=1 Tax=Actinotalea sp. M2MS4P-6 TaxID=2983762 RepID=UPI0021E3F0BB|nr:LacI family DNA-binding transcriptional regulator [Actinotalea sp. M2MS4P-6]MCV2395035.1 LacI family transcriptional regulator [Actinotalea sp. M2MS4P-6]
MPGPTIRTVAERAGVSKSLVSLVLRDSPHVSPERRAAVLAAIEELGYRPHAAARALSESRARAVGVLVDDLRNPWYLGALEGLQSVLGRAGLQVLLADHRLDVAGGETFVRSMLEMRADGIVLVGSLQPSRAIEEVARALPTVVLGNRDLDLPGVLTVAADDAVGDRLAVEHLVALGHRRIAAVGVTSTTVGRIRLDAYRRSMSAVGLDEHVAVEVDEPTEDGGYRAAIRLLGSSPRPTAVVCYNDMTALGAMSAARDLGLSVPDDLSVIGYDNTHLAGLRHIDLASVDLASREIGERAARALLVARGAGSPVGARGEGDGDGVASRAGGLELVPPRLVVRGSVGPAPSA